MPVIITSPAPAVPEFILVPDGLTGSGTSAVGTANTAYLVPVPPIRVPVTVSKIRLQIGAQSGNIDVGIYSWDGTTMTRVGSAGSTACPTVGVRDISLTAATTLNPGVRYFVAWAADNGTAGIISSSGVLGLTNNTGDDATTASVSKASSFPLPTTMTSLSYVSGNNTVRGFALRTGGIM